MPSFISAYRTALLELVEVWRKALEEMSGEKKYREELIRRLEKVTDHEEAGLSIQLK